MNSKTKTINIKMDEDLYYSFLSLCDRFQTTPDFVVSSIIDYLLSQEALLAAAMRDEVPK